jgi:ABC-type transport system involved in multi-copper enzyme maturation permease subunit
MLLRQLIAIIRDTFRELLVRKVLLGFLIVNVIGLIGVAVFVNGDTITKIIETSKQIAGPDTYVKAVGMIEALVAGAFDLLLTYVAIFTTASVIPTMLEKGTIDIYLSKPISRGWLLGGKIIGSLAVVAANIAFFILAEWIILSSKLGVWSPGLLYAGVVMLFSFTVLYGLVALMNVVSRTSALGIIVAVVTLVLISPITSDPESYRNFIGPKWALILDVFHYAFPQTTRIGKVASAAITGGEISWETIWIGMAQAGAYFTAAWWVLSKKEF